MKYVIDQTVAAQWYVTTQVTAKALGLRVSYIQGQHDLLAPDVFLLDCAMMLAGAEQKGILSPGLAQLELQDVQAVGIRFHSFAPLLPRVIDISLRTNITVLSSLYLALAKREQATFLTGDVKLLRVAQWHFPFVIDLATLP